MFSAVRGSTSRLRDQELYSHLRLTDSILQDRLRPEPALALLWQIFSFEGPAAVRAFGWWRLCERVQDCLLNGWETWLRRWTRDSFFPLSRA